MYNKTQFGNRSMFSNKADQADSKKMNPQQGTDVYKSQSYQTREQILEESCSCKHSGIIRGPKQGNIIFNPSKVKRVVNINDSQGRNLGTVSINPNSAINVDAINKALVPNLTNGQSKN